MPFVSVVMATSQVVRASFQILSNSILGYYLIRDTVRREKDGRAPPPSSRAPRTK